MDRLDVATGESIESYGRLQHEKHNIIEYLDLALALVKRLLLILVLCRYEGIYFLFLF